MGSIVLALISSNSRPLCVRGADNWYVIEQSSEGGLEYLYNLYSEYTYLALFGHSAFIVQITSSLVTL